jgi:hypothetical protein
MVLFGVAVPMPTFPFASTVIKVEVDVPAVVEAMEKSVWFTGLVTEFEMDS